MTRNLREIQCGKITRKSFGRIKEAIDIPYLVEIQKDSYDNFVKEGISEVLEDFSPTIPIDSNFTFWITFWNPKVNIRKKSAGTDPLLTRFL